MPLCQFDPVCLFQLDVQCIAVEIWGLQMQISCFPLGPVTEAMHQIFKKHIMFHSKRKPLKTAFTIVLFSRGLLFHWAFCRKVSMLSIFISLVRSSHRQRESHGLYSGRTVVVQWSYWGRTEVVKLVQFSCSVPSSHRVCEVLAILGFSIGLSENVRDWEQKCYELQRKQPEQMWRIWRYLKIWRIPAFPPGLYTGPVCSGLWYGGAE